MPPSILFIIKSDPQTSHRPAEAIRIAVGLGTGKNPLSLVLLDRAPLMLQYEELDLEDLDTLEKYLPILNEWEIPVHIESSASKTIDLEDAPLKVNTISWEEMAHLLTNADRVFVF